MHLVSGLTCSFRVRTYNMLKVLRFSGILQMCRSFECCKVANFQWCKCSSTFSLQGLQSFQCYGVFAVALKMGVGVTEFSKCCEGSGFFRVLQ